MSKYYQTCPYCGANLDPGEACDCREALIDEATALITQLTDSECATILEKYKKEAPASAANTDEGKQTTHNH